MTRCNKYKLYKWLVHRLASLILENEMSVKNAIISCWLCSNHGECYKNSNNKGDKMLDKSKVYQVRFKDVDVPRFPKSVYSQVKILFEDEVSFYVESLVQEYEGNGTRRSIRKCRFNLKEVPVVVPVARVADHSDGDRRLIIKLPENIDDYHRCPGVDTLVIDLKTGRLSNYWNSERNHYDTDYQNVRDITDE